MSWKVVTLKPAPSMMHDVVWSDGSYQAAISLARSRHAETGRPTGIYHGIDSYCWFSIARDGAETDRNTHGFRQ